MCSAFSEKGDLCSIGTCNTWELSCLFCMLRSNDCTCDHVQTDPVIALKFQPNRIVLVNFRVNPAKKYIYRISDSVETLSFPRSSTVDIAIDIAIRSMKTVEMGHQSNFVVSLTIVLNNSRLIYGN